MMFDRARYRDYPTYTSALKKEFRVRVQITHALTLKPADVDATRRHINLHLTNINELYHIQEYRGKMYTFVWFMTDISALAFILAFGGKII